MSEKGWPKTGIGAGTEGDVSGGEIDIPGCDARGLLDGGEKLLLLNEGEIRSLAARDVTEEEDDAVVGRADLDGEPEVEGIGVEVFELRGDALVHGAVEVIGALLGCRKLLPYVFAEEVTLDGEQLLCAAIEEGEVAVAINADDGVGGGLENLLELAGLRRREGIRLPCGR